MSININVVSQRLLISSTLDCLVAGSQDFVEFRFNLDNTWKDLSVFAQFRQNEVAYNQFLDSNSCVYLPAEIKPGTCTMMLYGVGSSKKTRTEILSVNNGEAAISMQASGSVGEEIASLYILSSDGTACGQLIQSDSVSNGHFTYTSETKTLHFAENIVDGTKIIVTYTGITTVKATTNYLTLSIDENTLVTNAQSTEISQSLYEQLVTRVLALERNENVLEAIKTAVSNELTEYLQAGILANMTIENGSITREKLNPEFESAIAWSDICNVTVTETVSKYTITTNGNYKKLFIRIEMTEDTSEATETGRIQLAFGGQTVWSDGNGWIGKTKSNSTIVNGTSNPKVITFDVDIAGNYTTVRARGMWNRSTIDSMDVYTTPINNPNGLYINYCDWSNSSAVLKSGVTTNKITLYFISTAYPLFAGSRVIVKGVQS